MQKEDLPNFGTLVGLTFDKTQWNDKTRKLVKKLDKGQKNQFEFLFLGNEGGDSLALKTRARISDGISEDKKDIFAESRKRGYPGGEISCNNDSRNDIIKKNYQVVDKYMHHDLCSNHRINKLFGNNFCHPDGKDSLSGVYFPTRIHQAGEHSEQSRKIEKKQQKYTKKTQKIHKNQHKMHTQNTLRTNKNIQIYHSNHKIAKKCIPTISQPEIHTHKQNENAFPPQNIPLQNIPAQNSPAQNIPLQNIPAQNIESAPSQLSSPLKSPSFVKIVSQDKQAHKKSRRVQLPQNFTGHLVVVRDDKLGEPAKKIEIRELEMVAEEIRKTLLDCIYEEKNSISKSTGERLAPLRPPHMSHDLFLLLCKMPIGMPVRQHLRLVLKSVQEAAHMKDLSPDGSVVQIFREPHAAQISSAYCDETARAAKFGTPLPNRAKNIFENQSELRFEPHFRTPHRHKSETKNPLKNVTENSSAPNNSACKSAVQNLMWTPPTKPRSYAAQDLEQQFEALKDQKCAQIALDKINAKIAKFITQVDLLLQNYLHYQLTAANTLLKHKAILQDIDTWSEKKQSIGMILENEMRDFGTASTHVLRFACNRSCLQWGRIREFTSWTEGQKPQYESSIVQEMLQDRTKSINSEIQEVFGLSHVLQQSNILSELAQQSSLASREQVLYYSKVLTDNAKDYREVNRCRRLNGRTQAMLEYAMDQTTKHKIPKSLILWKCLGVSCHSQMWQVYHQPSSQAMVAKLQTIPLTRSRTVYECLRADLKKALNRLCQCGLIEPFETCCEDACQQGQLPIVNFLQKNGPSLQKNGSAISPTAGFGVAKIGDFRGPAEKRKIGLEKNHSFALLEKNTDQLGKDVGDAKDRELLEDNNFDEKKKNSEKREEDHQLIQTTLLKFFRTGNTTKDPKNNDLNNKINTNSNNKINILSPPQKPSPPSINLELLEKPLHTPHANPRVIFASDVSIQEETICELTPFLPEVDLSTYLDESGAMKEGDKLRRAKWILLQLCRAILNLGKIHFLLPIKCSRIYLRHGRVTLASGLPRSLLSKKSRALLRTVPKTIASSIWADDLTSYLPPEADGNEAFRRQPAAVALAHTWMVGQVFYRMTVDPYPKHGIQLGLCKDPDHQSFLKYLLQPRPAEREPIEKIILSDFLLRDCEPLPRIIAKGLRANFKVMKALEAYPSLPRIYKDNRPVVYSRALPLEVEDDDFEGDSDEN